MVLYTMPMQATPRRFSDCFFKNEYMKLGGGKQWEGLESNWREGGGRFGENASEACIQAERTAKMPQ